MSDEPQTVIEPSQADKAKGVKPTKPLPTNRIAYQKQIDILRAYAIATEANGGKTVSRVTIYLTDHDSEPYAPKRA